VSPVQELDGVTALSVVPAEFLLQLGRAITPTALASTDFEESARWVFARYFWAFAARGLGLRLSEPAGSLVDHHRTLLSEQLGIALALHLATWCLLRRYPGSTPTWVDADLVLAGQASIPGAAVPVAVSPGRRMRPDYFFGISHPGSARVDVVALEAKGTHHSAHHLRQLRTGASQVASIVFGNQPPPGLIFSTFLSEDRIVVRAVDPPADEDAAAGEIGGKEAEEEYVEQDEEGTRRVMAPEVFRRELFQFNASALLAYAGAYSAARRVIPVRIRRQLDIPYPQELERPPEQVESELGTFAGIGTRLALRAGRTLDIFSGIAVELVEPLQDPDLTVSADVPTTLRSQIASRAPGSTTGAAATHSPADHIVEVTTIDGAFLRVRFP
jgi:hypothetical protein